MIELADIIAPVAPPSAPPPYEWIALGVVLLVLILFLALRLWLKRTRNRRLARTALKRTERALQRGKLDARAAAFQIARAVTPLLISLPFKGRAGEGMGANAMSVKPIPHLASPLKGEEQKSTAAIDYEWAEFKQALDRARFSPHPVDAQQAVRLLAQAQRWIDNAA